MSKKVFFTIPVSIPPVDVHVAIGYKTPSEFINLLPISEEEKEFILEEDIDESDFGATYFLHSGNTCIAIFDPPTTLCQIPYITHEIAHAIQHIFEYFGIELCFETTEVYSYMMDHIFKQILSHFKCCNVVLK